MNPLLIGPLVDMGKALIDRFFPDKVAQAKERAEAEIQLAQLSASAAQQIADALGKSDASQAEVNKVEAASSSLFVSGWRPAVGWSGAIAIFAYYVPYSIVALVVWAHQVWSTGALSPRPDLGISDLMALMSGILGLSYMRTQEKKAGVA